MAKKNAPSTINFEKSLTRLEVLVNKLEKGGLSLEEALQCFGQGVELARECQQALQVAEQKISVLRKQTDNWNEQDFDDTKPPETD